MRPQIRLALGCSQINGKGALTKLIFAVTYVNTVTGEVSNTPPPGFNPDTDPSSKSETVKDDICSFCYVASAEVACIDCTRFCTSCFTSVHASKRLRNHRSQTLDLLTSANLMCSKCDEDVVDKLRVGNGTVECGVLSAVMRNFRLTCRGEECSPKKRSHLWTGYSSFFSRSSSL